MAYGHDEYNTWQRVEIPFDNGGNLAIVLPDSMPGWGVSVNSVMVNVTLPRFTIDSMFDSEATIKAFEKLGVTDAFSAGDADFTKMIDTGSHGENLYIG